MLKVELHSHTADDPHDRIPYSAEQLIDRRRRSGYDALAVTLHDRQLDLARLAALRGRAPGIVLIPGIERTIAGKHVLLLNFPREAEDGASFAGPRRPEAARQPGGLVVAPHPYFPRPELPVGAAGRPRRSLRRGGGERHVHRVGGLQRACPPLGRGTRQAARRQRRHPPPVAAGHHLFAGRCAGRTADAICAAIAAGRVKVEATPLSWPTVGAADVRDRPVERASQARGPEPRALPVHRSGTPRAAARRYDRESVQGLPALPLGTTGHDMRRCSTGRVGEAARRYALPRGCVGAP